MIKTHFVQRICFCTYLIELYILYKYVGENQYIYYILKTSKKTQNPLLTPIKQVITQIHKFNNFKPEKVFQ